MDIKLIKDYLRVDFGDDDDFIKLLDDAANQYILNAVGKPALNDEGKVDEENPLIKLLKLTIISTLYDNRTFTVSKKDEKLQYTIRSILLQLQMEGED